MIAPFVILLIHRLSGVITIVAMLVTIGCSSPFAVKGLPSGDLTQIDQLVVHTDFKLPQRHRLLEELTALRGDLSGALALTPSDEPINVYLFEDRDRYETYMEKHHPEFPHRRAFFVKNDTTLTVYAFWGEKVAEDLRHEVTHGYLHSVVQNLPLWLDEGLAEYHEVPRGQHGINWQHIELLNSRLTNGHWNPDIDRLDRILYPDEMTQLDYAESWLWTHYMLQTEPFRREYLRAYIGELVKEGEATRLPERIREFESDRNSEIVAHLKQLYSLQK